MYVAYTIYYCEFRLD